MKKFFGFVTALALVIGLAMPIMAQDAKKVLKVGASPVPHAELLNLIKADLAKENIDLQVVDFKDYVQPNVALIAGDIDANFFQHGPYLTSNKDWNAKLVSAFGVHIEPFGLYTKNKKIKKITDLPEGAKIAIPNDPTNGGRALLLLQASGLIKLKANAGLVATDLDIVENPKKFVFTRVEAAQLPRVLPDVDAATINGNYALEAGLKPAKDALIIEGADSPYVNIVAVQKGKENDERINALKKALLSKKVKDFIAKSKSYNGGVVAVF
ncbi:ABC transporter substrate-binding protein [Spirochaetia bacterium]|nr:ABC transporter substrate-binding protein [Spirochaetia bacterium]